MTAHTVNVREYRRVRKGQIERVRRHKRHPRRWWKRPVTEISPTQ